ncbi:MAG: hypothetical protein ACJASR_002611 [Psychroserpens sp.]|jgi:hypothetical protein
MSNNKAVIVFRHGQKGFKGSDLVPDACDGIKSSFKDNTHPCYFDQALTNPVTKDEIKDLYYSDLSYTGYREGTSFATTVPMIMNGFQPITRAIVLDPNVNGNTYITTYPLLAKLHAEGHLKNKPEFYQKAIDIKDILPTDNDGSILITGTADSLYDEDQSFIKRLNKQYKVNADKPQRGRDIYLYYGDEELKTYSQDPDTKTVGPLNREQKEKPKVCIKC